MFTATGQALFGSQWHTELARALSIKDPRRIRAYAAGERRAGLSLTLALAKLIEERRSGLAEVATLLRSEISRLQSEDTDNQL